MNIILKANFGYELIFEADNIKVVEDIESREYPKDESGKIITSLHPERDIKTESLDQFCRVLMDMVYYRKGDFDSSDLIKSLFEKLPQNIAESLSEKLNKDYNE